MCEWRGRLSDHAAAESDGLWDHRNISRNRILIIDLRFVVAVDVTHKLGVGVARDEQIITAAAGECVGAIASVEGVVAGLTFDNVAVVAAEDQVVAAAAEQAVVFGETFEPIVAEFPWMSSAELDPIRWSFPDPPVVRVKPLNLGLSPASETKSFPPAQSTFAESPPFSWKLSLPDPRNALMRVRFPSRLITSSPPSAKTTKFLTSSRKKVFFVPFTLTTKFVSVFVTVILSFLPLP